MRIKRIFIGIVFCAVIVLIAKSVTTNYLFPFKHKEAILNYSRQNNLDPCLVLAIIKAESKFNSDARSNKDAVGLMQITEDTAEWVAKKMELKDYSSDKLYDEEYNIKMGCWYLNNLRDEFNDTNTFIAAYNAGRGNVNDWLNDSKYSDDGKTLKYIPYDETKQYVDRVNTYYKVYKYLYE